MSLQGQRGHIVQGAFCDDSHIGLQATLSQVEVQSGFLGYTRSGLHWTADAIGKLPALAFFDDCLDFLVMSLIHRAVRNQQTPMYVYRFA
jgi:hypothetical protein